MNRLLRHIALLMPALLVLASCSQTKNLPEDEFLYTGIKELSYGAPLKEPDPSEQTDSAGVIKAMGQAASYVKQLLSGKQTDGKVRLRPDSTELTLTPRELDSLRILREKDKETYEHVREEVTGALSYAPNGSLMGSSKVTQPFTPGLWIWNRYVNSESRFGRWMFNNFSQNPRTMTTLNPDVRTKAAQAMLYNNGYFKGRVDYQIVPQKNPRKQKISYAVLPGPLWHLDRIAYKRFPLAVDSILRRNEGGRLLHSGSPFSAADLQNERERIAELLQDRGYYYVQPAHIAYRADTVERAEHVQLEVAPAPGLQDHVLRQYYLGNTRVMLYKFDDRQIHDSIGTETSRMLFAGGKQKSQSWFARQYKRFAKRMAKAGRTMPDSTANRPTWVPPLRYGAIRHYLYYNKGDRYNRSRMDRVQERLSGMGVFSSVQMSFVPRDSTDTLDIRIRATLDKPYDSEFEGRITYKSNGQLGPGASYTISKKNAFRGAETLSFGVDASYEWQTGANMGGDKSLLNSWELGSFLNLSYPRFMFFGLGRRLGRLARATTNFKIDARWSNRAAYYSRVSMGGRVFWTLQRQHNVQHEITPFHLVYERQLSTTARFDEVMAKNPALAVSMRDQFVPSMEYTLTWRSRMRRYVAGQGLIVLTRRSTSSLIFNIKEAGAVTSCLYAIGGKSFSERDKALFGVPFAQFIRASVDYVHTYHITPRQKLLTRAYLGALQCYGNSITAPYGDLFAAGGANSIRGFAIRSIGPGSYKPSASNYSYLDQVGTLRFEANLEYRFPIVGSLFGAAFVDAGNVWLMEDDPARPGGTFSFSNLGKELALSTGFGLRYDLDFLVVRFDLGIGLHAPYDTGKSGYYNMPSFGKSLGYHFAIGYPF